MLALLVIGMGTSLPELSISLAAVVKRRARMSVGNVVGSNIFDTLMPVGVAAAIIPIDFDHGMLTHDLPFLFFVTLVVLVFFRVKRGLQKYEAAIILALYCSYALLKISGA